jgi:hypothetical protein
MGKLIHDTARFIDGGFERGHKEMKAAYKVDVREYFQLHNRSALLLVT